MNIAMRDISEGNDCGNHELVDLLNFHCLWSGGGCTTFALSWMLCSRGGNEAVAEAACDDIRCGGLRKRLYDSRQGDGEGFEGGTIIDLYGHPQQ